MPSFYIRLWRSWITQQIPILKNGGSNPFGRAITVRLKSTMLENPREIEGFQAFMRQKLKSIFRAQNLIICSTKGT